MIAWLLFFASALAQTSPDLMQVRMTVDDTLTARLVQPSLTVLGQEGEWAFTDPGDRVWVLEAEFTRAEELVFRVLDQGVMLDQFTHRLPNSGFAQYSYQTQTGEPPLIEAPVRSMGPVTTAPAEGLAPDAGVATPETGDGIEIVFIVDDRSLQRLVEPILMVDQEEVPKVSVRDDGSVSGDTPGDGLWMAKFEVRRTQYLGLRLLDKGAQIGQISVFLPSSDEAEIVVMTTQDGEGLDLVSEAVSSGGVGGPTDTAGAVQGSGRLAHVLWVLIALFAVAFTYLRQVVWRTWSSEVRPVLDRARSETPEGES